MPDPSGEPAPSSPEQPGGLRLPAPAGSPSHLAPAPRVHLPTAHQPKDSPKVPPPPPEFRAVLEWLRQYGNLDVDLDEPISSGPDGIVRSLQSRLPKEQRKFHKFDPEHPNPPPNTPGGVSANPQGRDGASGDHSSRGITAEQLAYIHRLRAETSERRLWIAVGVAVVVFLVVTGAFLASHSTLSKASDGPRETFVPAPKISHVTDAIALPAGVMDLLDQAMTAESSGDCPKAIELLERAQHDAGHIYGLNYHLASLCYKANEMARVLPLLGVSIADGEEVAACYSLRGTLSNQSEGTPPEPGDLEKATRLDPLNARFFFVWGEALRRAGKPQLALPQLQRAAARVQEPALTGVYSLKLRLTQVELGQDDAFAGEMTEKLKETPPSPDWLLTAAAVEMHRGDFPAAAVTFDKLRALIGERELARQLQDVFLRTFARETELARFFDVPVSQ